MPGAVIVADQTTGAGAGVPGTARNDLWLDQLIELSCSTGLNSSYAWELLDKPPGSSASLSDPDSATCDFTPDVLGTYRVRLVTNGGGAGNIQILVFRVRYTDAGVLADRGWALPGLGESGTSENNYGGNVRGYDEALRFIFADLLPWASGLSVLKNGTLVGQQRSVNIIGDIPMTNNTGANRVDITLTRYLELPLVAGSDSTDAETPGTVLAARQLNLSALPSGTKHFYLVATLVSNAVDAETYLELWNVTRGYMVTNGTLNNTTATDMLIAQTFVSSELTQGTSGDTIRSNTNDEYELRCYRNDGLAGDFVSCLNCHLRVTFD